MSVFLILIKIVLFTHAHFHRTSSTFPTSTWLTALHKAVHTQVLSICTRSLPVIFLQLQSVRITCMPLKIHWKPFWIAFLPHATASQTVRLSNKKFYSSLPQSAKEHLSRLSKRGVRAIFGAPPWTHTEPLLREMKLCSIDVRFKLKLLMHTYRCTHTLATSLLCQQYKLRSHSNSTHSTTRSQLTLSLCIPSAARRPGTISPCTLH